MENFDRNILHNEEYDNNEQDDLRKQYGEELSEQQLLEKFKTDVEKYDEIDNLIQSLEGQLKPIKKTIVSLKSEKKHIETTLAEFMAAHGFSGVNLPGRNKDDSKAALKYDQVNLSVPLTQSKIKEKIMYFFEEGFGSGPKFSTLDSKEKGKKLIDYIFSKENREKITKIRVKRTKYIDSEINRNVVIETD